MPVCVSMKLLFFSCSGGQNITIMGRNFDVIDNLIFSQEVKEKNVSLQLICNNSYNICNNIYSE